MLKCQLPSCETLLTGKQRLFCSKRCSNMTTNKKHQDYQAQQARGLDRKILLVKEKGGSCEKCGYKKNLASLCFHHRNGDDKDIRLDLRSLSNNSMKTIRVELEKCDLLCHNCHMEHHNPTLMNWCDRSDSNRQPPDYLQG